MKVVNDEVWSHVEDEIRFDVNYDDELRMKVDYDEAWSHSDNEVT